jgi:hypothetical protein
MDNSPLTLLDIQHTLQKLQDKFSPESDTVYVCNLHTYDMVKQALTIPEPSGSHIRLAAYAHVLAGVASSTDWDKPLPINHIEIYPSTWLGLSDGELRPIPRSVLIKPI